MIKQLIAVLLSFALIHAASPRAKGSVEGARYTARILLAALESRGWNVRDYGSSGLIAAGGSKIIRTTLYAGQQYKLVAAGCEDAYDVDIRLYDENGNFISGDTDATALAVADVTPRWTGTFFVKVTMYNATRNGAHYVMWYAYE